MVSTDYNPQVLRDQLRQWFDDTESVPDRRKRRWLHDPVGSLLRERLKATGNWKNAPRGNPHKGFAAVSLQSPD